MADRRVDVAVACDLCDKCNKFEIETEGVRFIDGFGHGLMEFKPHCRHLEICENLLELQKKEKEEQKSAETDA